MRIIRQADSWSVLLRSGGDQVCLHLLALRHGYRICEMCDELDCSQRYFQRVCVRDIGLAPKVWMRRERMVVARMKLEDGNSPEEVAADLGFSSRNNFRREFQTFHKVLPQDFQRERWGGEEVEG
jgi:AraC-like DNA-binding protein